MQDSINTESNKDSITNKDTTNTESNVDSINTKDLQNVDMSFLNKPWYSQSEFDEAYNKVYNEKYKYFYDRRNNNKDTWNEWKHIRDISREQFIKEYITAIEGRIRIKQGKELIEKYGIPLKDPNAESPIILLEEATLEIAFKITEALYYELYIDLCREEDIQEIGQIGSATLQAASAAANAGLSIALIVAGGANAAPVLGQIVSAVAIATAVITAAVDFIKQKAKTYPDSIQNIKKIITLWIHFAKISDENKKILLDGVEHYIFMQKAEYNDFMHPDDYKILNSAMVEYILFQMLPAFRQLLLRLARKGGKADSLPVMDTYPQAAGKDTTNEIDFAYNPQKDSKEETERKTTNSESKGKILDSMRGRDNADKAGNQKYDFEYANLGWDIKLEKAVEIDFLPMHAHNTAVAQTIKTFVLQLCSLHYAKLYWENNALPPLFAPIFYDYKRQNTYSIFDAQKQGISVWESFKVTMLFDDFARIESNIPLDMKEKEINPHIRKFNAESSFNALKQQQKRYTQGFNPMVINAVKLDLIDESIEKYYRIYQSLYTQLKNETKIWYEFIEFNETTKDLTKVQKIKVSKDILSHVYNVDGKACLVTHFEERTITFHNKETTNTQKYYYYLIDYSKPLNDNDLEKRNEKLANENINNLSDSEILESYYAKELGNNKIQKDFFITNKLNIRNKEYLNEYEVKQKEYPVNIDENGSIIIGNKIFYSVILYFKVTIAQATNKGYLQDAITKLKVQLAKESTLSHGSKETEDSNLDKLQNAELI